MLHTEALLVVDTLLTIFDLHGDIDMRVDQLLWLSDIHLLYIGHIVGHLFDWHFCFFLVDKVLDLLQLTSCHTTQSTQTHISHLFEDKVTFVCQSDSNFFIWVALFCRRLSWIDDSIWDARISRLNHEGLIKLSLIILLNTEWWDQIYGSVKYDHTVNLSVPTASSSLLLDQLSTLSLLNQTLNDQRGDVTLCILVLDLSIDSFKAIDRILHVHLVRVIIG